MSWFIKKVGKRDSVRASIEKNDENLPEPVKACVLSVLGDEPGSLNGVRVEGSGHSFTGPGSANSNIYKLEVEPIQLVES